MSFQPDIAVVLLNYNGRQLLERNLPFLISSSYINKQIIVIDNGSTDDSLKFLSKQFPSIDVIALKENKGYSGGYNEGLKQVKADYFLLLNTDVEVSDNFIEPMLNLIAADPSIEICQPKILSMEHRHMFEYAGAAGGFIDKYGYTFARGRILDNSEEDKGQYDQDCEIFWASGACFLIKASLFRSLEGFYEYFFMYAEEVDLCWRAKLKGKQVYFCYNSVVYHKETTNFIDQSPRRIYFVFRNNLVLLMKNLPLGNKLLVIPVRIILNIAAAAMFLLKGRFHKSWLVIKSIAAAVYWAVFIKNKKLNNRKSLSSFRTVYKKGILFDYYLRGKTCFSDLNRNRFGHEKNVN